MDVTEKKVITITAHTHDDAAAIYEALRFIAAHENKKKVALLAKKINKNPLLLDKLFLFC